MHERIRRTEEAIEFISLATRTIIYSPQHSIQHHGAQWKAVEDEKLSQLLDRRIFFNAERDLEHRKEEPSQICLLTLHTFLLNIPIFHDCVNEVGYIKPHDRRFSWMMISRMARGVSYLLEATIWIGGGIPPTIDCGNHETDLGGV